MRTTTFLFSRVINKLLLCAAAAWLDVIFLSLCESSAWSNTREEEYSRTSVSFPEREEAHVGLSHMGTPVPSCLMPMCLVREGRGHITNTQLLFQNYQFIKNAVEVEIKTFNIFTIYLIIMLTEAGECAQTEQTVKQAVGPVCLKIRVNLPLSLLLFKLALPRHQHG